MPIDLKVVPLREPALQEDPSAFLRALADDIDNGVTPKYMQAAMVVLGENGMWGLYTFGPGCTGDLGALGLLEMGKVILTDRMLTE